MTAETSTATRERLPTDRKGFTHEGVIYSGEGVITVFISCNLYPDGRVGEFFLKLEGAAEGISGMANCWSIAFDLGLQYGVPLAVLLGKFEHQRFSPCGGTDNEQIKTAKSIVDYVARWMRLQFCEKEEAPPDLSPEEAAQLSKSIMNEAAVDGVPLATRQREDAYERRQRG